MDPLFQTLDNYFQFVHHGMAQLPEAAKLDAVMMEMATILPHGLNRCCLKRGSTHERSVFATQHLKKGTLITFFPGDVVEYCRGKNKKVPGHIVKCCTSERARNLYGSAQRACTMIRCGENDLEICTNEWSLFGDPMMDTNASYLAHFIRDSFSWAPGTEYYDLKSQLRANCAIVKLARGYATAAVAIRDIGEGEEIFAHYGEARWINILSGKRDVY